MLCFHVGRMVGIALGCDVVVNRDFGRMRIMLVLLCPDVTEELCALVAASITSNSARNFLLNSYFVYLATGVMLHLKGIFLITLLFFSHLRKSDFYHH